MSPEDAALVVKTMAKYKEFFVDVMMAEELELQLPEPDHQIASFKEGVVMFCSFAVFGSLPLVGYVIFPTAFPDMGTDALFTAACLITGIVLVVLGCVKSLFCTAHWLRSGTETLLLGGACAITAYLIGQYIDSIIGGHQ
jgi:VIT1/CCC1 family predicted Fe2+/Mn2+ transporter